MDTHTARCRTAAAGSPHTGRRAELVWLRGVLGRAVVGPQGQHMGHVHDVVVSPPADARGSLVSGLIIDVGGHLARVGADAALHWGPDEITIRDVVPAQRVADTDTDAGGVFLRRSVLGQPVLNAHTGVHPRRITDVGLCPTSDGLQVCVVDTRPRWQRLCGRSRQLTDWGVLLRRRRVPSPPTRVRRQAAQLPCRAGGRAVASTRGRGGHRRLARRTDADA